MKLLLFPFREYSPFDSYRLFCCFLSQTPQTSTWMGLKSDLLSLLRLIDFLMTVTAAADGLPGSGWPALRSTNLLLIILSSRNWMQGGYGRCVWKNVRSSLSFPGGWLFSNTHSELCEREHCIFKCICCTTAEFRVLSQGLGNHTDGVLHDQNHLL